MLTLVTRAVDDFVSADAQGMGIRTPVLFARINAQLTRKAAVTAVNMTNDEFEHMLAERTRNFLGRYDQDCSSL